MFARFQSIPSHNLTIFSEIFVHVVKLCCTHQASDLLVIADNDILRAGVLVVEHGVCCRMTATSIVLSVQVTSQAANAGA